EMEGRALVVMLSAATAIPRARYSESAVAATKLAIVSTNEPTSSHARRTELCGESRDHFIAAPPEEPKAQQDGRSPARAASAPPPSSRRPSKRVPFRPPYGSCARAGSARAQRRTLRTNNRKIARRCAHRYLCRAPV